MRISLVHIVRDTTISYSHGLASIAAMLALESKVSVALFVVRDGDETHGLIAGLLDQDPDVVMITSMSNQWDLACEIATALKREAPTLPIAVGGSHVLASPISTAKSAFDIAVNGEGETVIQPLLQGLRKRKSSSSCELMSAGTVENLDSLPLPMVEMFPLNDVLAYPSVMFSRGCPYKCNYCMSRLGGLGGKIRWKSPARAIKEARQLVEYSNCAELYIDDDTFLKNPKWLQAYCKAYRTARLPPFYCNARPETVREAVCKDLAAAGCAGIGIGIESGSENLRSEVLGRRMTNVRIISAFDTVHAAGMQTWSFNMVGIPGETLDDLQATIDLNEQVQTDFVRVSIYTPYPGTPMYQDHDPLYSRGYIHPDAALPPDMMKLYNEWLQKLDAQGRLWFTEAEETLLPSTRSVPSTASPSLVNDGGN